ncbi:MAG TPA: Ty1/Copia family ribonuclease HI, partial [Oculatellaceae cyanobacterium]
VKLHNTPAEPKSILSKNRKELIDQSAYCTVVGKLAYYTQKIMVEGINASRELCKHLQNPGVDHWQAIKYMAGYLKQEKGKITVTYQKPKDLRFIGMVDANYATNVDDRKSVLGLIFTLGGTIIGWTCKTQKTTTLSSTEAEYVAISAANQELLFVQNLMKEMGMALMPGILFNNNKGAIALVKNRQVSQRTKHIDVCHHFIRDTWEGGAMDIRFVGTENNEADICTKNLDGTSHIRIQEAIRLGTLGVWINHAKLLASLPWREDVNKRDRDAVLYVQVHEADDYNDSDEIGGKFLFQKRMKISW